MFVSEIGVAFDVFFHIKFLIFDDIKDFCLRVINLSEKIGVESELIHREISQLWLQYTIFVQMVNVCATSTFGTHSWHLTAFSIVDT